MTGRRLSDSDQRALVALVTAAVQQSMAASALRTAEPAMVVSVGDDDPNCAAVVFDSDPDQVSVDGVVMLCAGLQVGSRVMVATTVGGLAMILGPIGGTP